MSKPKLTEARRPRGLEDRGPAAIEATRAMLETIRQVYERYGFEPVETPLIEFTEALGKFLPDQDRPNAGVFSFQDDDEQWLSLRYDLTAPLARYVAENFDRLPKPYRSYRVGPVFRNEKPGPGRFRQFMQFDADTVGAAGVAADAENCMMFADAMEALGIPRGSYVVKVNNRKVLDGVMEAIGVLDDQKVSVLRSIDKMDKFEWHEITKLLGKGRKDESGDFTKGAGLSDEQISLLRRTFASGLVLAPPATEEAAATAPSQTMRFPGGKGGPWDGQPTSQSALETMDLWLEDLPKVPEILKVGMDELQELALLTEAAGYPSYRIRIDPSVVRGLEYYTGPVYEVELTFEVADDDGKPVRFGSVGGGGRYDGLIGRFRAEDVPATGISIGVSRLQAALTHLGKLTSEAPAGPVVVTVMDKDRIAEYQQMVSELRNSHLDKNGHPKPGVLPIRAELYLGDSGFKAQMKYCDRRNSPLAIIQGGDEAARDEVQIKDLKKGADLAQRAKTITDREEYQRLSAQAQYPVKRGELVAKVREALGG
jgi:histidyl-tRNA synthetase